MDWDALRTFVVETAMIFTRPVALGPETTTSDCWSSGPRLVVPGPLPDAARPILETRIPRDLVLDFLRLQNLHPNLVIHPSCCASRKIDPTTKRLVCVRPGDYGVLLDPYTEYALAQAYSKYAPEATVKGSGHNGTLLFAGIILFVIVLFAAPIVLSKLQDSPIAA